MTPPNSGDLANPSTAPPLDLFMRYFFLVALTLAPLSVAVSQPVAAQDASARSVQQELKKRGFYVGEPSGAVDEAIRAALKRFQIREGLAVTGEIDGATLDALKKESPRGSSSPDEAPSELSARERAQTIVQSDRDFLESVERVDPHGRAGTPRDASSAGAPAKESRRPAAGSPPAATVQTEELPPRNAGAAVEERPANRAPADERSSDERQSGPISAEEAREFIGSYLEAAELPSPSRELGFYANEVDYFDRGKVARTFIEKDQAKYYRRWPNRDFQLVAPPSIERVSADIAKVRFRIRYSLSGRNERANGTAENVMRVRKKPDGRLKIISIRERKITE